jgi:hypothetical protein
MTIDDSDEGSANAVVVGIVKNMPAEADRHFEKHNDERRLT